MVRVELLLAVAGCSGRSEVVITGVDRHLTMPDPRTETEETVAVIVSDTNQIELPPGVFQAGERYELTIRIGRQDDQRYGYSTRRFGPFQLAAP